MFRASFVIVYSDKKCTQLFHKLSHYYMFRHYRVILRQLVVNTLPSYTNMSNAAVGIVSYVEKQYIMIVRYG